MSNSTATAGISRSRLRAAGRVLAWLAAVSALAAAISSIADVRKAGDATLIVETWRMYGFFLFAGLFALLARRPEGNGAVWGLVIANKLALTLTAIYYVTLGGVAEAAKTVGWDGALTMVLVIAYSLCRAGGSATT